MTKKEARDLMVRYHMINVNNQPSGFEGLIQVFNRLKSIQYDPLNVVGKNSDLVLQSRIVGYSKTILEDALYKDRILIDSWDKQMCIFQTKDYPYFSDIRKDRGLGAVNDLRNRLSIDALDYVDEIIKYIDDNGPTYSSKISLGDTKKHKWGHTKPSSATLDYLYHVGILGINKKKNTMKQYDLIENLIDGEYLVDSPLKNSEDFIKWYILRRISSMGLVSLKSGVMWSGKQISVKTTRIAYIEKLVDEGLVSKLKVEGIDENLYCLTESLNDDFEIQDKISFIAPLDNLIWDRKLIKKLFNFEYTWEVYTPIVKRKYGYYVLPILYGSEFIGRIEFEMHRNTDNLIVKSIWWEKEIKVTKKIEKELDKSLKRFERYLIS